VGAGEPQLTFVITYYPDTTWSNGIFVLRIPDQWQTPSSDSSASGYVEAFIHSGGNTLSAQYSISGNTITVNALNMSVNDYLAVIYGSKSGGGPGVTAPYDIGTYTFGISTDPYNSGSLTRLPNGDQPKVKVTILTADKSASKEYVFGGDTLTYFINYGSNSSISPAKNTVIWDTLPEGLTYISSNITPAQIDGNLIIWQIGDVLYSTSYKLTIETKVNTGIIKVTDKLLNTATIYCEDGQGTTTETFTTNENLVDVLGVKLTVNILSPVNNIYVNQDLTVLMKVTNDGNTTGSFVRPDGLFIQGTGYADLLQGPLPSEYQTIQPTETKVFTWIYKATSEGEITFSGKAYCYEGPYQVTVESDVTTSGIITINPEPTLTPTSTFTPTDTPTDTQTNTPTPTDTQTFTPTYTPTNTYTGTQLPTLTPTNTPTNTQTPTFTLTFTPIFTSTETPELTQTDTPVYSFTSTPTYTFQLTEVPTLTPTSTNTPEGDVYLNKNYIKPDTGEKLKITYKLPESGEVNIQVYNLNGELIKNIIKKYQRKGINSTYWDGRNNAGKLVSRGVYFIFIKQKNFKVIKKVVIIK